MGCDIESFAEYNKDGEWVCIEDIYPFENRCYKIFAFLAGISNIYGIKPISEARDLPDDMSVYVSENCRYECFGFSYLTIKELLEFNYDEYCMNEKVILNTKNNITYRELLGEPYFDELLRLEKLGVERIIFWFDH